MKFFQHLWVSITFCFGFSILYGQSNSKSPNIIYILADDLGYGDLGVYGQQIIETPHIDALAEGGMKFTQHYAGSAVCAPSRSVLLTGQHPGHTPIRGNDEWKERGDTWNYIKMFEDPTLEGQRPMPVSTVTMAQILNKQGYKTGMVGKWGLGAPNTSSIPTQMGFDYFIGYNCQRQAHTLTPLHLWENDKRLLLSNDTIAPHTRLGVDQDVTDYKNYLPYTRGHYAPAEMHSKAMAFLEENKNEPFFLYYASPLPHLPLQAPEKWINYYRKKIGPEVPYAGNKGYFPNQYPRATYAAMISYLDEQVGELIQFLKNNDLMENTLIIFSSDNGPTYDTGGADTEFFESGGQFGSKRGEGKGFLREGGIRVPMIAHWQGKIKEQSVSDHISAFWDVLPTLSDLSGAPVLESTDGISLLPVFLDQKRKIKTHEYLYWEIPEYGGQQAVRMGKWKAYRPKIKSESNLEIQLYDLEIDPRETNNIASEFPEIVQKMEQIIKSAHTPPIYSAFEMPAIEEPRD